MAAARHIKCKGSRLAKPPSRTSSAHPSIINSHQNHLHRRKSHTVINMCHAITGHRWKWHSHCMQRLILRTNLNSTASHKTAMHTTQHRSLHAPTKHRRCTPRVLVTANIANYLLPFTLHWCAMDIYNKLHIHPWSKYNTITQPNKMKAYCFDIKTGINETKQQSTQLEKNNNIHHINHA
jgi:hypothetical protein